MDCYIGTKIVKAEPMDEFAFSMTVRSLPHTVTVNEGGRGRDGYKVVYEDGYTSWSPRETFERAYRRVTPQEAAMVREGAF